MRRFADPGTEQDAMAEYLAGTVYAETAFGMAETPARFDRRIQNTNDRWVGGNSVTLTPVGTYETNIFDEGASEIVDYDPVLTTHLCCKC